LVIFVTGKSSREASATATLDVTDSPRRGSSGVVVGAIRLKLAGYVQGTCLDSPISSEHPIPPQLASRMGTQPRNPPGGTGGSREGLATRHRGHSTHTDETYTPIPHLPQSEDGGPCSSNFKLGRIHENHIVVAVAVAGRARQHANLTKRPVWKRSFCAK